MAEPATLAALLMPFMQQCTRTASIYASNRPRRSQGALTRCVRYHLLLPTKEGEQIQSDVLHLLSGHPEQMSEQGQKALDEHAEDFAILTELGTSLEECMMSRLPIVEVEPNPPVDRELCREIDRVTLGNKQTLSNLLEELLERAREALE